MTNLTENSPVFEKEMVLAGFKKLSKTDRRKYLELKNLKCPHALDFIRYDMQEIATGEIVDTGLTIQARFEKYGIDSVTHKFIENDYGPIYAKAKADYLHEKEHRACVFIDYLKDKHLTPAEVIYHDYFYKTAIDSASHDEHHPTIGNYGCDFDKYDCIEDNYVDSVMFMRKILEIKAQAELAGTE